MKDEYNSAGKPWLVVLTLLVAAVLVVLAFNAGANSTPSSVIVDNGAQQQPKTISVSGSINKMVAPDKVEIVLSVETLDASAQKSQSDNAVLADKVRQALVAAGVSSADVKTVSYSVNQEYEYSDLYKKSVPIGYRTANQIQITLKDTTKAGSVVDAAVAAGANRVSSISFALSDEKELQVREEALKEASASAKSKAESIASGLGVKLGKLYSVSESSFYYAPVYKTLDYATAGAGESAPSTPITSGDVSVTASVSVSFELG